jgi:hypothetical protein
VKSAIASVLFLAILGGQAHAYSKLADRLFFVPTSFSGHVPDEEVGDEFRRWRK